MQTFCTVYYGMSKEFANDIGKVLSENFAVFNDIVKILLQRFLEIGKTLGVHFSLYIYKYIMDTY